VIHVIEEVILPLDNIVATAMDEGDFTTLLAALDQAGLTATLEGPGAFTVFAPTDDAFATLLSALDMSAAELLAIDNLSDVLLYHVLSGVYLSGDVVAGAPFSMETLQGTMVDFTVVDGVAFINGMEIVTTDILTTNGVIHVIEDVLLPLDNIVATAEAAGNFTTLLAALDQAGLTATLEGPGAFTVFAPTDDAFLALLTALDIDATTLLGVANLSDILLYHVINDTIYSSDFIPNDILSLATLQGGMLEAVLNTDGTATINGVPVLTTNILTTNGVIHVIDGVLLPLEDIATTIQNNAELSTLNTALVQEGLDAALMGSGPFTLFAPTNAAFDALLIELDITVQDLLGLANLDQILQYHVLTDVYYSGDVVSAAPVSLASLQGSMLDFTVVEGTVFVNGIPVSTADVITTNGVIHIIDGVLLYE
jgi:transforming growth factor-beta-induced protein